MKFSKLSTTYKTILSFVVLFFVLVFIFPRRAKFSYDYRKGTPWGYETLIAQFDFPILKTEEQIRVERANSDDYAIPYYRYSKDVTERCIKEVGNLDWGKYNYIKPSLLSSLNFLFSKGVADEGVKQGISDDKVSNQVVYIQKDKRAIKYPVAEIFNNTEAKRYLIEDTKKNFPKIDADSLFNKVGLYDIITPNLIYDKQTTELVHEESSDYISPTNGFVNAGKLIVSEGEIVTAEIAQILDSYKLEFENSIGYKGPKYLFWVGNVLLALLLVMLLALSLYYSNPDIFKETNRLSYLLVIFTLFTALAIFVEKINPKLLYMIPFSLSALYLQAFFQKKVILPMCIISLMPLLIFTHDGVILFIMYLVADVVTIYTFRFFNRGWEQFVNAAIIFVSLLITYFSFRMVEIVNGDIWGTILYLFIGSMLTVAGYPFVYLFEKMFNLISNSRLTELCDTNNELLRRLEHTAPGTFQHSLQVMNMADVAARSIDANSLLVRAGALYHDIGKIMNPLCFIENESLVAMEGTHSYHEGMSPKESAKEIIKHVSDGLELAEKYHLPDVIKDFILTHHGTTMTVYFYNKYINEGGNPDDVQDFTYNGKKPESKEQMILMLCDSIEAASRTLKEHSAKANSDFVEKIVSEKMGAGQFENNELSIKELNTIKEALKAYLGQIYHGRVVYPHRKSRVSR
ncbi:MAG: HD family phosphohydrolase [Candidatus Cryptobacteroides sp.]